MTVNGQTETIKSAFYSDEDDIILFLAKDVLTELPNELPNFAILLEFSESLLGKTIDLTKPLDPDLFLYILGIDKNNGVEIYYSDGMITDAGGENALTVSAGTLTLTRNGDDFTVKISLTLPDGSSLAGDWTGKAINADFSA